MAKTGDKEEILKSVKEKKTIIYKGNLRRLTAYFSVETLQARRKQHDILKVLGRKKIQPRIFYPTRLHTEKKERERFSQTNKS